MHAERPRCAECQSHGTNEDATDTPNTSFGEKRSEKRQRSEVVCNQSLTGTCSRAAMALGTW